jgi:acyl-coenzyme A synthetase/AMP-(fatty) acid ligase/acyl carrier protein
VTASLSVVVGRHARQHPGAVAVAEPGLDLTYADLSARAAGLARSLAGAGVPRGGTVVAAVYSLSDLTVAAVASSSLGAVLYPFDIRKLLEARAERVELVAASAVVLAGVPDGAWTGGRPVIYLDEVEPGDLAAAGDTGDGDAGASDAGDGEASDGAATGFVVESERLDAAVRLSRGPAIAAVTDLARILGLTSADRLLVAAVTHSDLVLAGLLASLLSGGAAVSPGRSGPEGDGLCRAISRHDVTVLIAAPKPALLLSEVADADRMSFSALRSVVLARDWVPRRLPAALFRAAGPGLEIYTAWGSAESGLITAMRRADADAGGCPAPLGQLVGDQAVALLGDDGLPAAGELCVTGASVTTGFAGRPDLDALYLTPAGPARSYRTGDRGRRSADGGLELVATAPEPEATAPGGPADTGGRLRAVELAIEEWPAVRMARLIVTSRGPVVAFIETADGVRIEPAELLAALRAQPPADPGALPTLVVTVPSLPVTAAGVVDRVPLAARAERLTSPAAAGPGAASAAGGLAAGSGAARILQAVADVLGIPNLAPDMNLFEVGATSLEIVRVIADLEAELEFDVELEELLDAPQVLTLISQYHAVYPPSPGDPAQRG